MKLLYLTTATALSLVLCLFAARVNGQQTTVGAGMNNASDGFFEGVGVGFSARGPNWFFNNGGGGAIPPFGGFNPAAGASLGFGFAGPGFTGGFNINAAQGSSRSISSTAGSITVPNGGTAFIADVTLQPFVTSVVPVVGGFADSAAPHFGMMGLPSARKVPHCSMKRSARIRETGGSLATGSASSSRNPAAMNIPAPAADDPQAAKLSSAQASSAGRAATAIAAIHDQQSQEDTAKAREVQSLLDRGYEAQKAGKPGVARVYFEQASKKATGARKDEAIAAIRARRFDGNTLKRAGGMQ